MINKKISIFTLSILLMLNFQVNAEIPNNNTSDGFNDVIIHEDFGHLEDQKEAALKTLDRVACMTDVSIADFISNYYSIPRI